MAFQTWTSGHRSISIWNKAEPAPLRQSDHRRAFGELVVDGLVATRFVEKPAPTAGWINGGYFVFSTRAILGQPDRPDLVLETDVLADLSARGQLSSFQHTGYWQCMDTEQELEDLNRIWNAGTPPWKIW
jgi:glucose-1-phosphate cytidylyltransferase